MRGKISVSFRRVGIHYGFLVALLSENSVTCGNGIAYKLEFKLRFCGCGKETLGGKRLNFPRCVLHLGYFNNADFVVARFKSLRHYIAFGAYGNGKPPALGIVVYKHTHITVCGRLKRNGKSFAFKKQIDTVGCMVKLEFSVRKIASSVNIYVLLVKRVYLL